MIHPSLWTYSRAILQRLRDDPTKAEAATEFHGLIEKCLLESWHDANVANATILNIINCVLESPIEIPNNTATASVVGHIFDGLVQCSLVDLHRLSLADPPPTKGEWQDHERYCVDTAIDVTNYLILMI